VSDAIVTRGLTRIFNPGPAEVAALNDVSIKLGEGKFTAISGPSGSGKSTLLHLLGGLDTPTSGSVSIFGKRLDLMAPDAKAAFRLETIGFVFQFFNLIPSLTAAQNVAVSRMFGGEDPLPRARDLLEEVGLGKRTEHLPSQLSGGEMQRVAIARALMNDPRLILADEPTGNLDTATGGEILELFRALNRKGRTIVLVTHESSVAHMAHRTVELIDGRLARGGKA
jgi:putative ABC transport system ATP-binding protein